MIKNGDKISIIVPVYNVEKYIVRCIESIISQTYTNLEIILFDDGSTDGSGDICEHYSRKDGRIILIHQENQGLSMARNNAIDIATGEYLGFVDSDDWIETDMFELLYRNAIAYDADISTCNYISEAESKKIHLYEEHNDVTTILEGFDKISENVNEAKNYVWNKLYRRYLFDDIRFPKGKVFEDVFTTYKLIEKANKVVRSSKCKYHYLFHDDSITKGRFTIAKMDIVEAYIYKHSYIADRYPTLERVCRKQIFRSLLWCMNKAHIDNCIETHKEELLKTINVVKKYDSTDCDLPEDEKKILALIFEDIRKYTIGIRIWQSKQNSQNVNK